MHCTANGKAALALLDDEASLGVGHPILVYVIREVGYDGTGGPVVGASGDVSDMQHIFEKTLENLEIAEEYQNDGHRLRAKHVYSYLSRVLYARRNKFDPLWNVLIVAGWDDGKPYVFFVFSSTWMEGGVGLLICVGVEKVPLLRRSARNYFLGPRAGFRVRSSYGGSAAATRCPR